MEFDPYAAVEAVVARKTDKEREEEARSQAEQRAKLQLPTELDVRAQLGARMVYLAQAALGQAEEDFEYTRMAEGYALQGDYRKALELSRDPERVAEYQRIVDAVEHPTECGCPKQVGTTQVQFLKDKILFDGQVKNILACTMCRNIRC